MLQASLPAAEVVRARHALRDGLRIDGGRLTRGGGAGDYGKRHQGAQRCSAHAIHFLRSS